MSFHRSNSASSARGVATGAFGSANQHSSSYGPQQKLKLVNVCYIDKPRPAHNQSLNYINRKNEQAKQLEENLQMLKKIHGAEPTVKALELRRHEQQVKRLKKMVSDGGHRQSLIQVARDQVLAQQRSVFVKQNQKLPEFGGFGLFNQATRNEKKQLRTLWTSTDKVKKGRNNQRYNLHQQSSVGPDNSSTQGPSATLKGAKFKRPVNRG